MLTDLLYLSILSKRLKQLVILLESTDGFHRGLEKDPTENKDSYCESDLPCLRRLWTPPDQGQRQRPHATDCEDNKRFPEVPLNFFFCKARVVGGLHKLTAVFTLYRGVLNFFSAKGTLFHYHLFWLHNVQANPFRLSPFKRPEIGMKCCQDEPPAFLFRLANSTEKSRISELSRYAFAQKSPRCRALSWKSSLYPSRFPVR